MANALLSKALNGQKSQAGLLLVTIRAVENWKKRVYLVSILILFALNLTSLIVHTLTKTTWSYSSRPQ